MDVDLIQLILTASSYSAILPLGLGIFNWKYLNFNLKILSVYLFLSALIDITTLQLANNLINNLPLLYVFTVLEFTLFSLIYYNIFRPLRLKKTVIAMAVLFFLVVILSLYNQGASTYASIPRTLECALFTFYAITYFYRILSTSFVARVEKDAMFWYNGGILVYFAGSLLFFSLSSFILEHASLGMQQKLFITPAILNIVQKLLFTIGIWVSQRKK